MTMLPLNGGAAAAAARRHALTQTSLGEARRATPPSFDRRFFDEIEVSWRSDQRAIWSFIKSRQAPCFSPPLLRELLELRDMVRDNLAEPSEAVSEYTQTA